MLLSAISSSSVTLTTSLPGTNKSKVGSGEGWRKGDFFCSTDVALLLCCDFSKFGQLEELCQCLQNVAAHVRQGQGGTWSPAGSSFTFWITVL